jgi:hypothetical protein
LEIAAKAFAKAASESTPPLVKLAISKTVAAAPGLGCARLSMLLNRGAAAAKDEASFIARRRLKGFMQKAPL